MMQDWFKNQFRPWFGTKQIPEQTTGGALVKHYGENLKDPSALIHRANKRATGGDIEGALADFREAIQISPARATAFYNRGFLHNTLGNFEAAIEDFNRALELLPDYDEAYYQRGNSRLQLKELTEALQDFSRAIQLNPYSIKTYYKRAEAYAELGDTSGALADYAQVVIRVPKDANAYYQRGKFLVKVGELLSAIGDFTTAIEYNSRHADAYCSRGCCYAELGEMDKANEDFNRALLHNPSHQAAYYQRMYSLGVLKESAAHLQGLHQVFAAPPQTPPQPQNDPVAISAEIIEPSSPSISAREAAPQTLKLEPEDLMGYFERATKRAMNGDLEGAIADYTQIITLDPHNTQAYFRRGQNLSALGQEDEALKDLNQALHWARVHSLGQLKDFSGAISETIQTLKTELQKPKPSKTTTISTQAVTIEDSIADYTRTIEQQPTANIYFKRAQSRALLGDLQGAIADYTETIRLDPEYSEAYYRRGLSRSALGDTAGATQDLNQAIRRKPASGEDSSGTPSASNPTTPLDDAQLANAANLNPSNYCNHEGNRPGHRFCIHCGEMLLRPAVALPPTLGTTQPATLNNPRLPELSEAEKLLQRGRSQCQSGKFKEGLTDLSNALKLFLEEQQMERYQETLQVLQEFSRRV